MSISLPIPIGSELVIRESTGQITITGKTPLFPTFTGQAHDQRGNQLELAEIVRVSY